MNSSELESRLLDAMPAIIWSASASTYEFTFVSRGAVTLLGYPTQRWIEEKDFWKNHIHPDDAHIPTLCHEEATAGRDHELLYRMIAADGRIVWLRDTVKVRLADGAPSELYGVMVDVTREREAEVAEQQLHRSESRYRELVDSIEEILYELDLEGKFVSLSSAFERVTGHNAETWIGRSFVELLEPESLPGAIDHFHRTVAGDSGIIRQYSLRSAAGDRLIIQVTGRPRITDGVVAGTVGVARDVTKMREAEWKLEESKRLASLGQVAASLAHEFNNVLMGIQPFIEVIARTATPSPRLDDAIAHIKRSIARGKRASQEILRFANPQDARVADVEITTWLQAVVQRLRAELPPSITIRTQVSPEARVVRADRDQLDHVLTNLVVNARDAIDGSGTIDIDVSTVAASSEDGADDRFIRVRVTDSGPGVPPDVAERIFDPLFTTKRKGTGLGLSIARRLLEAAGGSLRLAASGAGGTSFDILLREGVAITRSTETGGSASLQGCHVLLVEDDDIVGEGLCELLKSEGFESTWVRGLASAIEVAETIVPDIAIIDVNLTDGSGISLIGILRQRWSTLPVILSTGHVELKLDPSDRKTVALLKPYQVDDLLGAINAVLR